MLRHSEISDWKIESKGREEKEGRTETDASVSSSQGAESSPEKLGGLCHDEKRGTKAVISTKGS